MGKGFRNREKQALPAYQQIAISSQEGSPQPSSLLISLHAHFTTHTRSGSFKRTFSVSPAGSSTTFVNRLLPTSIPHSLHRRRANRRTDPAFHTSQRATHPHLHQLSSIFPVSLTLHSLHQLHPSGRALCHDNRNHGHQVLNLRAIGPTVHRLHDCRCRCLLSHSHSLNTLLCQHPN